MNMTAFGAAIISNRQIKVNMLTAKLGAKAQVIVDVVMLMLAFAAIAITAWRQAVYAVQSFHNHVSYATIKLPQWPFIAVFSIAYMVGTLATLALVVRKVGCLFRGGWDQEAVREDMDELFVFGKKKGAGSRAAEEQSEALDGKDLREESRQ